MKRIVAAFLVILFAFSSTTSFADNSLSAYTLEQLFALKMQIEAEIRSRVGDGDSIIPQGTYIAGRDIKTGSFEISFGQKSGVYLVITTYPSESNFLAYKSGEMEFGEAHSDQYTFREEGESAYVNLTDGMILRLDGGSFIIKESQHSWKP